MLTKQTDFGHIVWLTEDEQGSQAVLEEIQKLKAFGRVAVLYPGSLDMMQVLEQLLEENKELTNT